jgi:hypothetical protein
LKDAKEGVLGMEENIPDGVNSKCRGPGVKVKVAFWGTDGRQEDNRLSSERKLRLIL